MLVRLVSPIGPLLAGVLLTLSTSRVTVAVFLALNGVLALIGTARRALREPPPLTEVV